MAPQATGEVCLAWTPDSLLDEPYVALQRASASTAPGTAPGQPVPVDLSASDMANGRASPGRTGCVVVLVGDGSC